LDGHDASSDLGMTLDDLRRFFASAPFMSDLGIAPIEAAAGRVVTALELAPRHRQHTGVVHAGVIGAMADHTMGAAAQTCAPEGHWVLTAEYKVSLLRAGRGVKLECVGQVIKPGRQVSFTEAEVFAIDTQGQRTLVATASATMAVVAASSIAA
jgi:uncharacterized protein (TIGR00369 family)